MPERIKVDLGSAMFADNKAMCHTLAIEPPDERCVKKEDVRACSTLQFGVRLELDGIENSVDFVLSDTNIGFGGLNVVVV